MKRLLIAVGFCGLALACSKGNGAAVEVSVSKVEAGRVTFKYVNDSDKECTGGYLRVYCYGADGTQSGVESMNLNFSLKAGATKEDPTPIRCAEGAAAVEAEWYYINYAGGTKWENPTQPPEKRAKGGK